MGVYDPDAFDRHLMKPLIRPATGHLTISASGLGGGTRDACVEPLGTSAWRTAEMGGNEVTLMLSYLGAQPSSEFVSRFIDDRPFASTMPIGDPSAMAALLAAIASN